MSLIKLALEQKYQTTQVNSNNKALNKTNFIAAGVGGTLGFAAKEGVEHIKGFDKLKMLDRYSSRMASVGGGLLGAGAAYSYLKRKEKHKNSNMVFM